MDESDSRSGRAAEPGTRGTPQSPATLRLMLYERLTGFLPAQFEETLERFGVPHHHMSPSGTPLAVRVRELLQFAEQRPDGFSRLTEIVTHIEHHANSAICPATLSHPGQYPELSSPNPNMLVTENGLDVLILTALSLEYLAVLSQLSAPHEIELSTGTIVEAGTFDTRSGTIQIGVHEVGPGNVAAAAATAELASHFRPKVLLFVGVAGGIKDVQLGDVVVATKVYGFEAGKADEVFKPRPEVGLSSHRLVQRARTEARKSRWHARIGRPDGRFNSPSAYVGPIAAGSQVVASTRSPIYKFLRQQYSDALAVEMEGIGFLEAAWRSNSDAMVVRGISDLIEGKQAADAGGSQPVAAQNAAAFAFEVLYHFRRE